MADSRLPRKLAAILYADVAGYSLLTGKNEDDTHRALRERLDLLSETIGRSGGLVVHYAGDAVLARFDAAVDALSAAVDAQCLLNEAAANDASDSQLKFRIGVNLGDIIEDRGDIYGDGVNIAARLESLADPGGICVSESIRTALGKKLRVSFDDMGPQNVKNISEPIVAYRVLTDEGGIPNPKPVEGTPANSRYKPSILVLPFSGKTDDAENDYFVDGITEEIRLGLCRFKGIMVMARGSSFTFKGKSIEPTEAARQVNADYVLDGSVRKAGNRIRVSTSLIKTSTEQQVWAERYDRTMDDLFQTQDEISQCIITKLVGRIEDDSKDSALGKRVENLSAYDCVLRGNYYFGDWRGPRKNMARAAEMYQKAIDLDHDYAAAYVGLASVHQHCFNRGWTDDPKAEGENAIRFARKAVQLDPDDSLARLVLSSTYFRVSQNYELASSHIKAAIELNPNHYWNYCFKCWFSTCTGDLEEGIQCGTEAIQRNPLLPDGCLYSIGFAEYLAGRYEQAIDAYGRMSHPHKEEDAVMAACFAQLGRDEEAQQAATEFRNRMSTESPGKDPGSDREQWKKYWIEVFPLKDNAALDHFFDGLTKAGLIE